MNPLERYYATEYHRRNMQVARVCGANASVDKALERAKVVSSIPKWLIAYLESAAERLPGLQHDLAAWRDMANDSPYRKDAEPPTPCPTCPTPTTCAAHGCAEQASAKRGG